jgi:hypothetical protein
LRQFRSTNGLTHVPLDMLGDVGQEGGDEAEVKSHRSEAVRGGPKLLRGEWDRRQQGVDTGDRAAEPGFGQVRHLSSLGRVFTQVGE